MKKTSRVLIVDDHPIFREGLAMHLNRIEEFEVCGEAESADEAMGLLKKLKPDLVIVDITLKESSGLELVRDIRSYYDDLVILVLSMHEEALYAERVIRSGAGGYVMKQESTEKIVDAIKKVLEGKIYVSEKIMNSILKNIASKSDDLAKLPIKDLTDREFEIFELIGQGFEVREISDKLSISVKTIQNYRESIREKLNLKNNTALIQFAYHWIQVQGKL